MVSSDSAPPSTQAVLSRLAALTPGAARIGSFADQGFQGVGNILANALLARALTHSQYASLGVMIGVHYLAWGVHRSVIVLPLIVNASDAHAEADDEDGWWWINLIAVALIAAALVLVWRVYGALDPNPRDVWAVDALGYAALASPFICYIEFARRRLYQQRRGVMAAVASAVSTAGLLSVAVFVWRGPHDPLIGAAGWAFGAALGGLVATLAAPPHRVSWSRIRELWARHQQFALWQTLTAIPYAFYTSIVVLMVAGFAGPAAAAAFTAARTLTNPAMAVVSAIDTLDKPRAARALLEGSITGLQRSIQRTMLTVIGLTGPYLTLLALFSGTVLHIVFGKAFAGYGLGVSLLAIAAFFACLNQAPETNLIVLRAGRQMFWVRTGVAVFTVVSFALAGRAFGFLGCAAALLVTNLLNLLALRFASRRQVSAWGTS